MSGVFKYEFSKVLKCRPIVKIMSKSSCKILQLIISKDSYKIVKWENKDYPKCYLSEEIKLAFIEVNALIASEMCQLDG